LTPLNTTSLNGATLASSDGQMTFEARENSSGAFSQLGERNTHTFEARVRW